MRSAAVGGTWITNGMHHRVFYRNRHQLDVRAVDHPHHGRPFGDCMMGVGCKRAPDLERPGILAAAGGIEIVDPCVTDSQIQRAQTAIMRQMRVHPTVKPGGPRLENDIVDGGCGRHLGCWRRLRLSNGLRLSAGLRLGDGLRLSVGRVAWITPNQHERQHRPRWFRHNDSPGRLCPQNAPSAQDLPLARNAVNDGYSRWTETAKSATSDTLTVTL